MKLESTQPGIDTSRMNSGQRRAIEVAEGSRDQRALSGFAASLFAGKPEFNHLLPFPQQDSNDRHQGDAFLERLGDFLNEQTDPDQIDRDGEIPNEVLNGLAKLGAFAIKIPRRFGGLGLSQTNYSRAAMQLGQHCGNLTALLSAHQSIGVPQPLILFGNEAQKARYLREYAQGKISAFALTEEDVGSDPSKMTTTAVPTQDGKHFILNGEKLWCTNGILASHIIVMARTPMLENKMATTAFIVDMNMPGVEKVRRCHFMGLRALYNGVIRFTDVKIPIENVVHEVGKGLKVALTTLNTGRLTLPAACSGMMHRCLDISLRWSKQRRQWGKPIGQHAAIAAKLADMAADAFATEAMVLYTSALVDANKKADIRLEAALAKLWGTEAAWKTVDETMQIKGGRGYETADSLKARGQKADPIERMMRDCRINRIFEGSSEIMRLFIAREMLDPHLREGGAALDTRQPTGDRLRAGAHAAWHYTKWYPSRWIPDGVHDTGELHSQLHVELLHIGQMSRHLSRAIFHNMVHYGPKLEQKQLLLGRLVDIGAELFAMSAACAYTQSLIDHKEHQRIDRALEITRYLCKRGEHRVQTLFKELNNKNDGIAYKLAQHMMGDLELH